MNIQSDDDFACHALNRDVWRDELVENLVREGFILWQAMSSSNEGLTYITRYKVTGYPHLAIIDPRTGSLLWRKESWTQINPLTAEQFVEIASDFCSGHSFDKLPMAPSSAYANSGIPLRGAPMASSSTSKESDSSHHAGNTNNKRPIQELTDEEQLQAAIRASMQENSDGSDDEESREKVGVERQSATACAANNNNVTSTDIASRGHSKLLAFEQISSMEVGVVNPADSGTPQTLDAARPSTSVAIRLLNGRRLVVQVNADSPLTELGQHIGSQAGTEPYVLTSGFPPVIITDLGQSVEKAGLKGAQVVLRKA